MALPIRRIDPAHWQPVGIDALEDNAIDVVQSTNNRSVIAGPGSGKTELLAQRACYLLQCGIAPIPQRILAISYKRDAAANLATRVRARVHPELGHRFDSLTFDAFSKGLLDRFGQALPKEWRPTQNYEITNATFTVVQNTLELLSPPAAVGTKRDIIAISVKTFEKDHLVAAPLALTPLGSPSPAQWAAREFWQNWLHGGSHSVLTFAMIGRLAELLVRTNPMVRDALHLTYSHLFMDEFQDTTQVQYDLAKTIFWQSETVVTAVGDHKQQIMRWAMAMDDPFTPFETEFGAIRTPLFNNYRSSPDLVRIQDVLAKALDGGSSTPISKAEGTIVGNSCEVWDFSSVATEATLLADFVAREMIQYSLQPRDFAFLVRMKAVDYFTTLQPALAARGILLRNEAAHIGKVALQELFSELLSETLITVLRVATSETAGRCWSECLDAICSLRGLAVDDDDRRHMAGKALEHFSDDFVTRFPTPPTDENRAEEILASVIDLVGRANLLTASPAYRQGDWFARVCDAARMHLVASSRSAAGWKQALDTYEGLHAVPLMTVHKSKGLEYHTVIFVGLDDGAWFNFRHQSQEEMSGFFVAFTRAKQRVIFTYCAGRGRRQQIAPLYALLKSAGVQTIKKS
ncbi:ATP-dependent DNA helicase pcrA [Rhodovulum sp. PH10]|uniref:UvrD-helicase domain-containing protein n=1 Tax=Rhodovulum sp. PH10 TaxID=1187851 RepID=UPI00027C23CE|nr:ATP-dependent helicase [Rhodovulum sp. PH10]EJW10845.1 ATP-dependent DNA helicase pcrA [Rhodovulum sp. PH10]